MKQVLTLGEMKKHVTCKACAVAVAVAMLAS